MLPNRGSGDREKLVYQPLSGQLGKRYALELEPVVTRGKVQRKSDEEKGKRNNIPSKQIIWVMGKVRTPSFKCDFEIRGVIRVGAVGVLRIEIGGWSSAQIQIPVPTNAGFMQLAFQSRFHRPLKEFHRSDPPIGPAPRLCSASIRN
jgi:hypothetical protein